MILSRADVTKSVFGEKCILFSKKLLFPGLKQSQRKWIMLKLSNYQTAIIHLYQLKAYINQLSREKPILFKVEESIQVFMCRMYRYQINNFKTFSYSMIENEATIRAECFSAYGYHAKTIKDINRSNNTIYNQIYEIEFNGLGKIMTVRDKYELLMGNPWIYTLENKGKDKKQPKKATPDLHPFFVFLVKKIMKYDAISLLKMTDYNTRLLKEFKKKEDDEKGYPSTKINQLVSIKHELQKKLKDMNSRLQRLKWFYEQLQEDERICLTQYRQLLNQGYCENVVVKLSLDNRCPEDMLYMVGMNLFQQVKALQPLTQFYQSMKIKLFEKNHKNYYLTSFTSKKEKQNHLLNTICIKKPTRQPSLLHNIEQHVRLRQTNVQPHALNAFCSQIIKNLVEEVKQYMNKVSNDYFKGFYEFIQPKNVLIDQMSLKPKLSFNPLLLEAIGLRNKPLSIENMISFFPTPQTFDYFQITPFIQSLTEENLENELIMNDSFYGCIELFGEQGNKLQAGQIKDIVGHQRIKLERIKQKVLVWKILLTSYYLTHGKQFGPTLKGTTAQNRKQFKHQINQASRLLKRNFKNLDLFLTIPSFQKDRPLHQAQEQSKQFNFTFEQLYNYLGLNQQSDEIIEDMKYKKIKRYHQLRKFMLREIIKVFMNDEVFKRLYNVKKYIITYCVIALEMVEQTYDILSAEQKRCGERKQLMQNFDKYIRKLKNQKSYVETLNSTFKKIQKYKAEERDSGDKQVAYINKEQEGMRMYQQILKIKDYVSNIANNNEKLNKLELILKEQDQIQDEEEKLRNKHQKQHYKVELEKACTYVNSIIQTIRNLCYEVTITCFKAKQPESLHKYEKGNEESKESHRIYSIELKTTLKAFLCLQPNNLLNYETLIVPYLNLDENQIKPQVRIIKSKEARQNRLKTLELVDELLMQYAFKKQSKMTIQNCADTKIQKPVLRQLSEACQNQYLYSNSGWFL